MKIKEVAFANADLQKAYFKLREGKFEEKQIFDFVTRAINDLKENPFCGIKVPKGLWPKEYIKNYGIDNLWKYNLPNAWRLIYTIIGDEVKIVSMILEWLDHKNYEKRFGY
jgi:Txe/YoeB family toxin of Txe-Axe toxin-antitoxin module